MHYNWLIAKPQGWTNAVHDEAAMIQIPALCADVVCCGIHTRDVLSEHRKKSYQEYYQRTKNDRKKATAAQRANDAALSKMALEVEYNVKHAQQSSNSKDLISTMDTSALTDKWRQKFREFMSQKD